MNFDDTDQFTPAKGASVFLVSFIVSAISYFVSEKAYSLALGMSFILFMGVTMNFFNSVMYQLKRLNGDYDE